MTKDKKQKKLSKAKLTKLMHEQFGIAEVELVVAIDAITQAVMMKYTNEALEGKRDPESDPTDELIEEVSRKMVALFGVALSNYFSGGKNGTDEGENPAETDSGATEKTGK